MSRLVATMMPPTTSPKITRTAGTTTANSAVTVPRSSRSRRCITRLARRAQRIFDELHEHCADLRGAQDCDEEARKCHGGHDDNRIRCDDHADALLARVLSRGERSASDLESGDVDCAPGPRSPRCADAGRLLGTGGGTAGRSAE